MVSTIQPQVAKVSTTQAQVEPLPGAATDPEERCLNLSCMPRCASIGGDRC